MTKRGGVSDTIIIGGGHCELDLDCPVYMRCGAYKETHTGSMDVQAVQDVSQDLLCWQREMPDQMRASSSKFCPTSCFIERPWHWGFRGAGTNASTHNTNTI